MNRLAQRLAWRSAAKMWAGARLSAIVLVLGATIPGGFVTEAVAAETIVNVTLGRSFDDLAEALAAARDGDTIEVGSGTYTGNFVVDRRVTLIGKDSGADMPVLDGGGTGTVLTVRADGAVIENLRFEHSGSDPNPWLLWGDAGVLVDEVDEVILRGLTITGNDWGVVMRAGEGSLVEKSTIEDNVFHGVRVLGGRAHRIVDNTVNHNGTGISVDALFPGARESPLARLGSPDAAQLLALQKRISLRSADIEVSGNEVRGNGFYGIEVAWESERITVANNHVHQTGIERPIDEAMIDAWERSLGEGAGGTITLDRSAYGSGIYLFCLVKDSTVSGNRSHDNLSIGIGLNIVSNILVVENEVFDNATGIWVASANENRFERNNVRANSAYGIRIAVSIPLAPASSENLLTLNDMAENGENAFDSSGQSLTAADLEGMIDTLPWPEEVKEQMRASPQLRQMLLQTYLEQLKPASNHWDDGEKGNHYDDFDEAEEGFLDENSDGIGETPHPIPGGTSVDHYPLAEGPL